MEIEAVKMLLEYGTTPAVIFLIVLVVLIRRDIAQRLEKCETTTKNADKRIGYIEREYVQRNDYYKDISGWREDINRIGERIDRLTMEIVKK